MVYTALEFIGYLMRLDGLVAGNYHCIEEDGLRTALHRTTIAISHLWDLPSPASLMSQASPATTLSRLIEARRAQEFMFTRRNLLLLHADPKRQAAIALNWLLVQQTQQIDNMILRELGIFEMELPEEWVVFAGGLTKRALEAEMLANF